ncbi:hypothetical protein BJX70DRAFT_394433 [Aspergillus crustosus]
MAFPLSLEIHHLKPTDNGDGWRVKTQPIFETFPDSIGPWVIAHLSNIEELSLDASEATPLGKIGHFFGGGMSLEGANMPRLQKLTLRNMLVCTELRDFLLRHLNTLQSVTLQQSYSMDYGVRNGPEHIFWYEPALAGAISSESQSPMTLTSFEICYDESEIDMMDLKNEEAGEILVSQVRRKMRTEPNTRPFFMPLWMKSMAAC